MKEWLFLLGILFFSTEISFLFSNVKKFLYGGWFTFIIAALLFSMMYLFQRARSFRNRHFTKVKLDTYKDLFEEIIKDNSIQKEATNLVFMTKGGAEKGEVDANIIYSIFNHKPKRADIYWFVNVEVLDNPHSEEKQYSVKTIIPGKVFFVQLSVGFKVKYSVGSLFQRVVEEMVKNGEVDEKSRFESLRKHDIEADFKYVFVKSMVPAENALHRVNKIAMATYSGLYKMSYPLHLQAI